MGVGKLGQKEGGNHPRQCAPSHSHIRLVHQTTLAFFLSASCFAESMGSPASMAASSLTRCSLVSTSNSSTCQCTEQHSTTQHSMAQHSTAQHDASGQQDSPSDKACCIASSTSNSSMPSVQQRQHSTRRAQCPSCSIVAMPHACCYDPPCRRPSPHSLTSASKVPIMSSFLRARAPVSAGLAFRAFFSRSRPTKSALTWSLKPVPPVARCQAQQKGSTICHLIC